MDKRQYEVGIILRADMSDDDIAARLESLKAAVEQQDGSFESIDHWGRRTLAYPIAKQRDGYYVFVKAQFPPALPAEVERLMRIDEAVLRYLVIRAEE